ncbi:MAG: T9SS type A sorting domain-containing protein [Chlorobi bacterium]|nr:T9SS type A sorting domain-containing protein [Chlorobiota bacterium]
MMKLSFTLLLMLSMASSGFAQWVQQTNPGSSLNDVFMVDENIAYAVGGVSEGTMIKTTNGGATWQVIPSFTNAILHCVHFSDADTGYVAGQFGTMFKTTDGGVNWSQVQTGTTKLIVDIEFLDANTGFACGSSSMVIKTTNGGLNWENIDVPVSSSLSSLDFTDVDTGFIIGGPFSYKTTDGGLSWQEMTFQYTSPSDIFMIDGQTGFVSRYNSTEGGGVFKTIDGGNTWTLYTGSISEPLSGIFFTSASTGYACGGYYSPPNGPSSYIIKTTNGGESWFEQDTQFGFNLLSIYFGSELNGIAVGGNLIARTVNGGGVTGINTNNSPVSPGFHLSQNNPNPFHSTTTIKFTLRNKSMIKLEVFNTHGKKIATLANSVLEAGEHKLDFDARHLPNGIYYYYLSDDSFVEIRKMVLLR